jgi:hypothetical protein
MSAGFIKVSVPSEGLMTLLGDNPEIMVEIHRLAAEKMAEHVVRKVKAIEVAKIQSELDSAVTSTINLYKRSYTFPLEAQSFISKTILETLDREFARKKDDLVRALNQRADIIEAQLMVNVEAKLAPKIAAIARAEFIKVMQEVRSIPA